MGGVCSLLLPDTVGFPLPNTFEDVERIKQNSKSFWTCQTAAEHLENNNSNPTSEEDKQIGHQKVFSFEVLASYYKENYLYLSIFQYNTLIQKYIPRKAVSWR